MTRPHSTTATTADNPPPKRTRPPKPYPHFPLTAHLAGQWCKKIRGKLHYFGTWDDPEGALKKYLDQKDALHAGRRPREDAGGLTVKQLANAFLVAKEALRSSGELTQRTWDEYKACCDLIVSHFGKGRLVEDLGPDDFAGLRARMTKTWGPVTLGNNVQKIRCVFKFAADNGLVDRSVRYGQGFARPSKKVLRLDRAKRGVRMFEAEDVRRIIAAAGVQLRAMVLLGVNCGYGNADCGTLPLTALDLGRGWVDFPRPKTGIRRRCPLWPETVAALREALARRPDPKDPADAGLVFVTKYGESWYKSDRDNPVSKETAKLLTSLGLKRPGLNFYALRHTFETIGGAAKDQVAVDHIMGHARDDMASVYRERIGDDRLRAVVDHVRAWLFPPPA